MTDYARIEADANRRPRRRQELILEVTEALTQAMGARSVTRAELARRLGSIRGHITQLLAGGRNLTLGTIAEIADALGCTVEVRVVAGRRQCQAGELTLRCRRMKIRVSDRGEPLQTAVGSAAAARLQTRFNTQPPRAR